MIEVLAGILPAAISALDVAAGRGDDAHVHRQLVGAAERAGKSGPTSTRRILFCVSRGHVGDLVDEQRAAVGFLERADLAFPACRSAPPPRTARSPSAPVSSPAALITTKGPSVRVEAECTAARAGELLAGAGGSDDQDAAVGGRDLVDGLAQQIDRGRMPDQCRRRQLPERLDIALEARVLKRARCATSTRRSALNGFSMKS